MPLTLESGQVNCSCASSCLFFTAALASSSLSVANASSTGRISVDKCGRKEGSLSTQRTASSRNLLITPSLHRPADGSNELSSAATAACTRHSAASLFPVSLSSSEMPSRLQLPSLSSAEASLCREREAAEPAAGR